MSTFRGAFSLEEVNNYGGQGGAGFFSLKDDKDVAVVRFCYNTIDDIHGYAVHEIEIDGKKRYVACLRRYNQPISDCPLCAAAYRVLAKLFLHIYEVETGEIKIWDRGKTFFSKMGSLCARHNPLVSTLFEIERNGKKGDAKTTYETYPLEKDDTTLDDLPEIPNLLGTFILDKNFDDLTFYVEHGYFMDSEEETVPRRNVETTTKKSVPNPRGTVRRRIPVNNNQDKF